MVTEARYQGRAFSRHRLGIGGRPLAHERRTADEPADENAMNDGFGHRSSATR